MTKKQTIRILRIVFIIASITSLVFVPWILVKAWILPLPDTVQEQVNEAIGHGFDGMIVYVDQAGKPPEFYAAGWHDQKIKYLPTRKHYSRLPVSASCIMLLLSPNWSMKNVCLWIKRSLITFQILWKELRMQKKSP